MTVEIDIVHRILTDEAPSYKPGLCGNIFRNVLRIAIRIADFVLCVAIRIAYLYV